MYPQAVFIASVRADKKRYAPRSGRLKRIFFSKSFLKPWALVSQLLTLAVFY